MNEEEHEEERRAAKIALFHLYKAAAPSAGVRYYVKHFDYDWLDEMDVALNSMFKVRDSLERRLKNDRKNTVSWK